MRTNVASLRMYVCRGDWRWRKGEEEHERQFYLDWRPGEALPAAEEVAVFAQPLHLRAPYNTVSLGHLIRDNLQFLVDLPIRFGREPAEFDWVRARAKPIPRDLHSYPGQPT